MELNQNEEDQKEVKTKLKKLNDKHHSFINNYMLTNNGRQSAINAGFSEKSAEAIASQLLNEPLIKKEIDKQREVIAENAYITKEELLIDLITIKNQALANQVSTKDGLKAIEMIVKMLGYNEPDKIETSNIQIKYIEPTDFE